MLHTQRTTLFLICDLHPGLPVVYYIWIMLRFTPLFTLLYNCLITVRGAWVAQWLSDVLVWSKGNYFESRQKRENLYTPGSDFCADSYFGISSTPVLPQ